MENPYLIKKSNTNVVDALYMRTTWYSGNYPYPPLPFNIFFFLIFFFYI